MYQLWDWWPKGEYHITHDLRHGQCNIQIFLEVFLEVFMEYVGVGPFFVKVS